MFNPAATTMPEIERNYSTRHSISSSSLCSRQFGRIGLSCVAVGFRPCGDPVATGIQPMDKQAVRKS
jgi:hypothetical protein